jgi:hypothetical protein
LATAVAVPVTPRAVGIAYTGILFLKLCLVSDSATLPLLTLPYATYRARSYDSEKEVYIFANIRFAAPPIGDLRWAEPADPVTQDGIQDGSVGGSCFQSTSAQVSCSLYTS